jgi:hypothetical protein
MCGIRGTFLFVDGNSSSSWDWNKGKRLTASALENSVIQRNMFLLQHWYFTSIYFSEHLYDHRWKRWKFLEYTHYQCLKKNKNKDQQGKGNIHRAQPPSPTHLSRAPRRHKTPKSLNLFSDSDIEPKWPLTPVTVWWQGITLLNMIASQ